MTLLETTAMVDWQDEHKVGSLLQGWAFVAMSQGFATRGAKFATRQFATKCDKVRLFMTIVPDSPIFATANYFTPTPDTPPSSSSSSSSLSLYAVGLARGALSRWKTVENCAF